MTDPFVAADRDVRDLDGFMLNVERLLASELVAIGTPEECWAALMLWCRAWKQVPGGSLPNDERILASFSGAGKRWPKVRDTALHGFELCSDGRLYHRFLCAEVERAYAKRVTYRQRREADRERLVKWRAEHRETLTETLTETPTETPGETRFETCFVALETGTGTGTGTGTIKKEEKLSLTREPKEPAKATRLPKDFVIPPEWIADATAARQRADMPECDLQTEGIKFSNFWNAKSGKDGAKLDWRKTWINWALSAKGSTNGTYGQRQSYHDAETAAFEYISR